MTIPEAAQLVIQATVLAEGGELFLLDMGEPVKIKDLALQLIKLSGLTLKDEKNNHGDIEIIYKYNNVKLILSQVLKFNPKERINWNDL